MTNKDYQDATIKRAEHDKEYFIMNRHTAQDKELSFEARGMIAYILSKKDGWEMQVHDLKQKCAKGRVYRILDELIASRYLEPRTKYRDEKGHWQWTPYILHECPYPQNRDTEKRDTENADIKQSTELEITDKESTLSAPKAAQDETPEKQETISQDNPELHPELKIVDKLSSDEYQEFIDVLEDKYNLIGKGTFDVYHQLRGSIAVKNKKTLRYQHGEIFRDKPVDLLELKSFIPYWEIKCPDIDLPTSAAALEKWFGKYRKSIKEQANKPKSFFQQKRPTNYNEIMEAQGE